MHFYFENLLSILFILLVILSILQYKIKHFSELT